MKRFLVPILCALTLVTLTQPEMGAFGNKSPKAAPMPKFSRSEYMVMNLNKGPKSAGFFISQSLKETRDSIKTLDRALRQVEQVDREYAKSKGRPDDRYLAGSQDRIREALKAAQQLEQQLVAAREELKFGIQKSLVSP